MSTSGVNERKLIYNCDIQEIAGGDQAFLDPCRRGGGGDLTDGTASREAQRPHRTGGETVEASVAARGSQQNRMLAKAGDLQREEPMRTGGDAAATAGAAFLVDLGVRMRFHG